MTVKLHVFFTSVFDEGKWSPPSAESFIRGKIETGTRWAGGRLGFKTVIKRKIRPRQ
jgi:hypothetical protein